MTLYLECTGLTDACRTECGRAVPICRRALGSSQAKKGQDMLCACGKVASGRHKNLCACSLGPQADSHFRCPFRLKVISAGPSFAEARIYVSSANKSAHADEKPAEKQLKRKVPETFAQFTPVARHGLTAGQIINGSFNHIHSCWHLSRLLTFWFVGSCRCLFEPGCAG